MTHAHFTPTPRMIDIQALCLANVLEQLSKRPRKVPFSLLLAATAITGTPFHRLDCLWAIRVLRNYAKGN